MIGLKNVTAYIAGKGLIRTNIGICNGKIAYIGDDCTKIESLIETDGIVVAGFIDEHIHGAGGADVMDATESSLQTISESLVKEGTTAFLATTMTQSRDNISLALENVKSYMQSGNANGAELLGVHLEGPFISPKHIGAQPLEYVVTPDVKLFDGYNDLSGNNIKIVSLAPEEKDGLELVKHLKHLGIIASVGHSGASYDDIIAGVELGLSNVTHTFNAQTGVHHREIGIVGSAMLIDQLNCEIICDAKHVSIPAIKLLIKNKPHDKITLITDSMRSKGLPDGVSELGGQKVIVKDGFAKLENGTLAGSVLKMNNAIKNLVEAGVSFTDAIDFATINPAKNLGIFGERGSIEVGKRADFTILDKNFNVLYTIIKGEVVYRNNQIKKI